MNKPSFYNDNCKPFIEPYSGGYICGYKRFNGYRMESLYINTVYRGIYTYTLDYTFAKRFTMRTAKKHFKILGGATWD